MSCCGKSRLQFKTSPINTPPVGTVLFEYTGRSRLTVIGPVTRIRYDFAGHGARVQVDRRDSNAIAMVPSLKRV
jgi:hypothetical protein